MALETIDQVLALFKGGCGPEQVPPGEVSVIIYPDPQDPEPFLTVDTSQSFTELFQELVGNNGSDVDAFDTAVLEVVGIIDALDAALGKGIDDLFDAFDIVQGIGPDSIAEDVLAFHAGIPTGTAIVNDFGGLVLAEPPPPGTLSCHGGDLQITPATVEFSSVPVNTVSPDSAINIKNVSQQAVGISSVELVETAGRDFVLVGTCPGSLAPSDTCTLRVVAAPTLAGDLNADLRVTTDQAADSCLVHLHAVGAGDGGTDGRDHDRICAFLLEQINQAQLSGNFGRLRLLRDIARQLGCLA